MSDAPVVIAPDSVPQPQPPPPTPWRKIFVGPNGIRAGWRFLIFVALVRAFVFLTETIGRLLRRGPTNTLITTLTPALVIRFSGLVFIFSLLAALIMARIEKRRFSQYGLPVRSAFGKDFWCGTLVGFAAISGCLLFIFAFHGFRIIGLALHGMAVIAPTAAWALAFVLVGLNEEFGFRGYPQFTLTTGIGFWPSAFLTSALFGLVHAGNSGESRLGELSVVLFGLLFCLFLYYRGNLWYAVGFHAGWDWGETFFYGVPDSGLLPSHHFLSSTFGGARWLTGGSAGPEASVFCPITLVVVAVLFRQAYGRKMRMVADSAPG